MFIVLNEIVSPTLVTLIGNGFQREIECGRVQQTVGMCKRLNKTITVYICPSTMTYKKRRENKEVMYNFKHGSKFEVQPTII